MIKRLIAIILLIPSLATPCTCPTGHTCTTNGIITVGINQSYGANIDFLALNSDCKNQLWANGYENANFGTWGYADQSLIDAPDSNPTYATVDNMFWNLNQYGNSEEVLGGENSYFPSPVVGIIANGASVTYKTPADNTNYTPAYNKFTSPPFSSGSTSNGASAYSVSSIMDWNYFAGTNVGYPAQIAATLNWSLLQGYLEQIITLVNQTAKITFIYHYLDSFDHSQSDSDPTSNNYIGPYDTRTPHGDAGGSGPQGCNGAWAQQASFAITSSAKQLYYYGGNSPWTNGALTAATDLQNATTGAGVLSQEDWVAAIDTRSGLGIGLYSPQEAGVRALGGNNPACLGYMDACSLTDCGPNQGTNGLSMGLAWNFKQQANSGYTGNVWQYDTYLTVGTIGQIRSAIYSFATRPQYTSIRLGKVRHPS